MATALRPMSTGEVLDRTFNLYRNHFWLFIGIGAGYGLCLLIGILILILFGMLEPVRGARFDFDFLALFVSELVIGLSALIGYAVAAGPTVYAVSRVHLDQAATVRESYSKVGSLMPRSLRIVISIFLRCFGALMLSEFLVVLVIDAIIPLLARGAGHPAVEIVMPIVVFGSLIAGGVWSTRIFCRNLLAIPAALLERIPARQALTRSRWLTKKSLGRNFLVLLLTGLLGAVLFYAFLVPGLLAAGKVPRSVLIGWQAMAGFAALTLSFPIGTIATALLYYDQRVRKEAFDLQLMMESVGQQPEQHAQAGSAVG